MGSSGRRCSIPSLTGAAIDYVWSRFKLTKAPPNPGSKKERRDSNAVTHVHYHQMLISGWQSLMAYMEVEKHPSIRGAKHNLTDYLLLDHVEDLPPSDVVAGLKKLQSEQQERWKKTLDVHFLNNTTDGELQQSSSTVKDLEFIAGAPESLPVEPQPWMTADNALYYMRYPEASYGWPKYVVMQGMSAVWKLAEWTLAQRNRSPNDGCIIGDTMRLHTRVIQAVTGLHLQDLVYISFFNKGAELPFYVGLDHETKNIVVAIRGTMSIDDLVTDLDIYESEHLAVDGVADAYAHRGMFNAAKRIMQKLVGCRANETDAGQIEAAPDRPILQMAREKLENIPGCKPDEYRLMITGHSLGACVAGVLAVLMQREDTYKDLMCFSYAPIGGLVSVPLARHCEKFVCSVVLQDDFFIRMNLPNAYDLKINVLKAIKNCDESKRRIDQSIAEMERKKQQAHPMSPPGCVLFIRELVSDNEKSPKRSFQSTFIRGSSPLLQELNLCSGMFVHHCTWWQWRALQYLKDNNVRPIVCGR